MNDPPGIAVGWFTAGVEVGWVAILRVPWVDVLERGVLDRLCIGTGNVVMGALSIDTSGGGSGFADGMMGTVNKASGAGTTPILATAFSVGK